MKIKLSQRPDMWNPETGVVNQDVSTALPQQSQQTQVSQTPHDSKVIKRTKTPDGGWHILAETFVGDAKKIFYLLFDKENKLVKKWEGGAVTAKINYRKKIMAKLIKTQKTNPIVEEYFEIITPESAKEGDVAERGFVAAQEFELDKYDIESGLTIPDLIVTFLKNEGANEFSSSVFDTNGWYIHYGSQDMYDGSYENNSFHLGNIDDEEKKQVYEKMFGKSNNL